jgi:predicted dehydrogenase
MTVRVAVVGLGMMGTTHFKAYQSVPQGGVVAVCDVSGRKLSGDWSGAAGNIDTGAARRTDLSGLRTYDNFARLLGDKDVDLVDLCVPTDQHAPMAVKALRAGKHVFCEKPMAVASRLAKRMIAAAAEAGRMLAVGHVLRFWPEYVMIKQMIDDGRYGRVRSAVLTRLSARPAWSWDNWSQDPKRSGAAALDLHIHDTDTVQWFFGRPLRVTAAGTFEGEAVSHIWTTYHLEGGPVVTAEGGWDFPPSLPFRMTATVVFEMATVEFSTLTSPTLTVHDGRTGKAEHPPVPAADAYAEELRYFIDCVASGRPPERIDPADAAAAVAIVEAEVRSARRGRPVAVRI